MSEFSRIIVPTSAILAGVIALSSCTPDRQPDHVIATSHPAPSEEQKLTSLYGPIVRYAPEAAPNEATSTEAASLGVADPKHLAYTTPTANGTVDTQYSYYPVLRVRYVDGKLRAKDSSPSGIDPEISGWLISQVAAESKLITPAFAAGRITELDFALERDDMIDPELVKETGGAEGFYLPSSKKAVINFSNTTEMSLHPDEIREMLDHETIHSLFSKLQPSEWYTKKVNPQLLHEFSAACTTIRDIALDEAQAIVPEVIKSLQQAADVSNDPPQRQSLRDLVDEFKNHGFQRLLPDKEDRFLPKTESLTGKLLSCTQEPLYRMRYLMQESHGLAYPDPKHYNTYKAVDSLDTIDRTVRSFMAQTSIYTFITESNYGNGDEPPALGHLWDNIDEIAASYVGILINYPDEFAQDLQAAGSDGQKAILNMGDLIINQLAAGYPSLGNYFTAKQAALHKALQN